MNRLHDLARAVLDDAAKLESIKAAPDLLNDLRICVAYPQNAIAVASFGVVDTGEKAGKPFLRRIIRPSDDAAYRVHARLCVGTDGMHESPRPAGLLENEMVGAHLLELEIALGAQQRFNVADSEPELMLVAMAPTGSFVRVRTEQGIAPHNAAQVSAPILRVLGGSLCEGARTH